MGESSSILPCPNAKVIKKGIYLNRIQQLDLIRDVTAEEVMDAIKFRGVDGFPIKFFTQH